MTGFESMVLCLALSVYHEARSEPTIGQIAVAQVIINRAKTRNLDICAVVYEPMQFSWANEAFQPNGVLKPEYIPKGAKWVHAKHIAATVLGSNIKDFTGGATHYHADYISKPKWAYNLKQVRTYGRHIFYK